MISVRTVSLQLWWEKKKFYFFAWKHVTCCLLLSTIILQVSSVAFAKSSLKLTCRIVVELVYEYVNSLIQFVSFREYCEEHQCCIWWGAERSGTEKVPHDREEKYIIWSKLLKYDEELGLGSGKGCCFLKLTYNTQKISFVGFSLLV